MAGANPPRIDESASITARPDKQGSERSEGPWTRLPCLYGRVMQGNESAGVGRHMRRQEDRKRDARRNQRNNLCVDTGFEESS